MKIKKAAVLMAAALMLSLCSCSSAEGTGEAEIKDSIKKIDIEWSAGTVTVMSEKQKGISLSEADENGAGALEYRIAGSDLRIYFGGDASKGKKDLRVTLPEGLELDELEIRADSADAYVIGVNAGRLDVETAGGGCTVRESDFTEMAEISSESGNVNVNCKAADIDLESVSGDVFFASDSVTGGEMETDSGTLRLTLPEDAGFKVKFNTDSGKLRSDFEYKQNGSSYTVDGGGAEFRLSSGSGFAELRASAKK